MPEEQTETLNAEDQREIVSEARQRLEYTAEYESEFRNKFIEDIKFVYDDQGQWEQAVLKDRSDRPCYTFNRTEGAVDELVGDQRTQRPSIRIRPGEGGDKEIAETYNGLIRNILVNSDADTIQDHAFTFSTAGGYGVWRVVHEYVNDRSFNQEIYLREIANPLTAYGDPAATDICKRDARYWIITEKIPKSEFEDLYPDVDPTSFTADDSQFIDWYGEDEVRIAEYYRRVITERTLILLSDGRIMFKDEASDILDELEAEGVTIVKEREVGATAVEWYKLYGDGVLEGPLTYNWRYIPVVPVYGKRINIEGEYKIKGIVRNAKDPQRSYNYIRSVITEKALLTPKFQYILTPKQLKGHQEWWNNAHASASPYILANPDPALVSNGAGGMPTPAQPNPVPVEMVTIAQMDAEDIKTATGKFDAQLGAPSQERSGVAIREKRIAGDLGSFVYVDNLAKAVRFTGEILVDMIPQIYDTERQVRILGEDGSDELVFVNQVIMDEETKTEKIANDLSVGQYDVHVDVGPSFMTLRQEAGDRLAAMGAAFPQLYDIAADIVVDTMDIPGGDEVKKRFRKLLLAQGIVEPTDEEREEMEQNQPQGMDPMQILLMRQLLQRLEKESAETDKLRAQTDEIRAETAETEVDTIGKAAEIGVTPTGQIRKIGPLNEPNP